MKKSAVGIASGIALVLSALVASLAEVGTAADRKWQTGTWGDITVKRRVVDFGPGASGFGRPGSTPEMRALADVRHFVIETDEIRIEAEDTVSVGRRSFEAIAGAEVKFVVEKNTVFVRDPGGTEHKLRLLKKTVRSLHEPPGAPSSPR